MVFRYYKMYNSFLYNNLFFWQAEDNCEQLTKELLQTKTTLIEIEEEKKRLESEAAQLKEMLRREHDSAEGENSRNQVIIGDYKQVNVQIICKWLCMLIQVTLENMMHVYSCML